LFLQVKKVLDKMENNISVSDNDLGRPTNNVNITFCSDEQDLIENLYFQILFSFLYIVIFLVSILSSFHEQLFDIKVLCTDFFYLQFDFVIFVEIIPIGAKYACKIVCDID